MPEYSLFSGSTTNAVQVTETQGTNQGLAFHPLVDGFINEILWFSGETGNRRPDALTLYEAGGGAPLAQAVPPTNNTGSGWTSTVLPSPVFVAAGTVLVISAHFPGTVGTPWQRWQRTTGNLPNPGAGLTFEATWRRQLDGVIAYPTVASSVNVPMVDVIFSTEYTPPPTSGATVGSVANELAGWLSLTDQQYPTDSLPYLTHGKAGEILDLLNTLQPTIDSTLDIAGTALGPLGDLTSGALKAALDALRDYLEAEVAEVPGAVMGPGNPTIADVMNSIAAIPPPERCGFPLTVGDAEWTEVDQTVGAGGFAWAQPADAYKLHIEEVAGEARTALQVGLETIYWLRGWARPWDGVGVYPQNIPLVGLDAVIVSGERWPGIMMWFPPGVEWVLTAYDYTP